MPGPMTRPRLKLRSQSFSEPGFGLSDSLQDPLSDPLQDNLGPSGPPLQRQERSKSLFAQPHGVPPQELAMLQTGSAPARRRTMSAVGAEYDGRLLRAMVEDPLFGRGPGSFAGLDRAEDDLSVLKRYYQKARRGAHNKAKGQGADKFFEPLKSSKGQKVKQGLRKGALKSTGPIGLGLEAVGSSALEQVPFVGPAIGVARDVGNAALHNERRSRATTIAAAPDAKPMLKKLARGSAASHRRRSSVAATSASLKVGAMFAPFPGAGTLASATASGGGKLVQHGMSKARATRLRAKTDDGALLSLLTKDDAMRAATMDHLSVPPASLAREDRRALRRAHRQSVAPKKKEISAHMQPWLKLNPLPPRASDLMAWDERRQKHRARLPAAPQQPPQVRERLLAEMKQSFKPLRGVQNQNPELAPTKKAVSMKNPDRKLLAMPSRPADPWAKELADSQRRFNKHGRALSEATLRPSQVKARVRGEKARLDARAWLGSGFEELKKVEEPTALD
jgi:hypothetical protein